MNPFQNFDFLTDRLVRRKYFHQTTPCYSGQPRQQQHMGLVINAHASIELPHPAYPLDPHFGMHSRTAVDDYQR